MSRFQRRHQFREPKKFFIIATEGECTEDIYFSGLKPPRDAAIQLKILPTKKGKSAPKEVLARLKSYDRDAGSGPRDELWLVIDRDSWTEADLDAVAATIGELPKYHLALSNPCFELWLVLHRRDPAGLNSEQLRRVLSEELGSYEKGGYDVDALLPTVADAIRRAERMDRTPGEAWPHQHGTHVYKLVQQFAKPTL